MYAFLADIIVALHLLWIGFLIFGALIGCKVHWAMWLHISALAFSVVLQLKGWLCPLTHLENYLRAKSGWTYSGPFIQYYIEKLVYLEVSRTAVMIGTILVIAGSLLVYWKFGIRRRDKIRSQEL